MVTISLIGFQSIMEVMILTDYGICKIYGSHGQCKRKVGKSNEQRSLTTHNRHDTLSQYRTPRCRPIYIILIEEYSWFIDWSCIPGSRISIPSAGGPLRGGCSRTVQGQSSLQLSTSIMLSAGWILWAAHVPSGMGVGPPRSRSVQKKYVHRAASLSTRHGCLRGHFRVALQELQTEIRLHEAQ